MVKRIACGALAMLAALCAGCVTVRETRMETAPAAGFGLSVTDFGAVGDAKADNTAAFQRAMDAAAARGGGLVRVPAGVYLFSGTLRVPPNVTLEGEWRAPQRGEPVTAGTALHVLSGGGDENGTPFLRMGTGATLKGITVFYPEQIRANPPVPYPWTIQADGPSDNIAVVDVTLVNPYQGVDFGTYPAGRHLVRNLYGYPLYKGLYVNQCYDVGRLENVHFWPFWDLDPDSPLWAFTREKGTAFIFGKTDGEMGHNLFSIFYNIGMHFIDGPIYGKDREIVAWQPGSGMYTNCYMDVSPCAIRVDSAMEKAGISFVNASVMSKVVVAPTNRGQVKFTGSGFWATGDLDSHAVLQGRGTVFFEACHFNDWDRAGHGAPCIDADNLRLIVTGCEFPTDRDGHLVLRLGPRLRSAVVTSNLMPGGELVERLSPPTADIQIALNAVGPRPAFVKEWLLLGPFPNPVLDTPGPDGVTRAGFNTDWLAALGGEARAELRPGLEVAVPGQEKPAKTRRVRANTRGIVDIFQWHKQGFQAVYAFTRVHSPKAQRALFDMGFNDGGRVWVNGKEVFSRFTPGGMQCSPGMDCFEADLVGGTNTVLVKIEDGGGRKWEFVCEIYGEDGQPLETGAG